MLISEILFNIHSPFCLRRGKVLSASWEAISNEVRHNFIEAESERDAMDFIDLGLPCTYTAAEAILWAFFSGVSFATQVATVVSREAPATRFDKKIGSLFKEAKTISFPPLRVHFVNKFLLSPVFRPRPRTEEGHFSRGGRGSRRGGDGACRLWACGPPEESALLRRGPPRPCGHPGPC
jgi:hypothetical protein